jgi:hypothetical protein
LREQIKNDPKIKIKIFECSENTIKFDIFTTDKMGYDIHLDNGKGESAKNFDEKKFWRSVNKSLLNRGFDENTTTN